MGILRGPLMHHSFSMLFGLPYEGFSFIERIIYRFVLTILFFSTSNCYEVQSTFGMSIKGKETRKRLLIGPRK